MKEKDVFDIYEKNFNRPAANLAEIETAFTSYLDDPVYNLLYSPDDKKIYHFKRHVRGDYSYTRNVEMRIETFVKDLYAVKFFDAETALKLYDELKASRRTTLYPVKTFMLYIVATYDPKKTTLEKSYQTCCDDVNLLISRLKKRYKCRVLRFFTREAHDTGMCHLNIVVLMERPVKIFPHKKIDKKGDMKITWRVREKRSLEKYWPHGFIDVQAVSTIIYGSTTEQKAAISNGALSLKYLTKYLLKNIDTPENRLTYPKSFRQYAMLWWARRRAFSLPENFNNMLEGLVAAHSLDLIKISHFTITKTTLTIPLKKFIWIKTITQDPCENREFFDRLKQFYLEKCMEYHPERFDPSATAPQREIRCGTTQTHFQKGRLLTDRQACDVYDGIDNHPEIPFLSTWA